MGYIHAISVDPTHSSNKLLGVKDFLFDVLGREKYKRWGIYSLFFIDFIIITLEIYVVGIEMYKGEISYKISSQWREDTGLFVLHEQKKNK